MNLIFYINIERKDIMVSFNAIATHSTLIDENEFFQHYFDPNALFKYDSNFFQLSYSPTKEEFLLIEEMHQFFSIQNNLEHVKFYWPQDEGIRIDTLNYLNEKNYGLEKLELYSIDSSQYPFMDSNADITIEVVEQNRLDAFKTLNYVEDLTLSKAFAEAKRPYYDRLFNESSVRLLLASYKGNPAGSCIVIKNDEGLEIDDLFTLPSYRHKGVASAVLNYVAKDALRNHSLVFLLADAEDSPREMYLKYGFQLEGFRIGAQHIFEKGSMDGKVH